MELLTNLIRWTALAYATSLVACATLSFPTSERVPQALRGDAASVTVLVFGSVDCPIANVYAPEIERIYLHCTERGVRMFYVHPIAGVTMDAAVQHAREFGLTMPLALDADHVVVRAVGATVTPEAAVLRFPGPDRYDVVYRGRIDDLYAGLGQRRAAASTHELRDAIDAAADGREPAVARTTAYGCFIEMTP